MARQAHYEKVAEMVKRREAGASWDELVEWTGWQRNSCRSLASRFRKGKIKAPVPRMNARFPEGSDEIIRSHWEKRNGEQIALILNRLFRLDLTGKDVNRRAWGLGLRKPGHPVDWWSDKVHATWT